MARVILMVLIVSQLGTIACGGASPTAPTGAAGYAGEWLGPQRLESRRAITTSTHRKQRAWASSPRRTTNDGLSSGFHVRSRIPKGFYGPASSSG